MSILELIRGTKDDKEEKSTGLFGVVEGSLKEIGWSYERDDKHPGVLRTGTNCGNIELRGCFLIDNERELLLFYVTLPNNTPDGRRREVMEFITRANYGLKIGCFEMDMDDGDIRFKVSLDAEGCVLSPITLKNILGCGFSTVDRYYSQLMSVMYGNSIPAAAIREVES